MLPVMVMDSGFARKGLAPRSDNGGMVLIEIKAGPTIAPGAT